MRTDELSTWLGARIVSCTGRPHDGRWSEAAFESLGLTSADLVQLSGELEDLLGRALSPTLLYDHPSPRELIEHLAADVEQGHARASAVAEVPEAAGEPAAVIGMGCRFPGADGIEALWSLLIEGRSAVAPIPPSRTELYAWSQQIPPGARHAALLDDIGSFDHRFFGISRREAEEMDPQQRLLLETTWAALEDADIVPECLSGQRVGVFIGQSSMEYALLQASQGKRVSTFTATGNAASIAANRISYLLNLRGPSLVVDTACSASLVALHLAVQSLRRGECSVALVGGVSAMLSPALAQNLVIGGAASPSGVCRPFSNDADGTVRGEGVGVLVLKALSRACAGGDRVYACVRGTALDQDGKSNGLTAPSGRSQRAVISAALRDARILPEAVGYVECHGTGTPLGDPIEAEALAAALSRGSGGRACGIGSIKSNLGHTEAAAGIAGVMKVVLAIHHAQLPPTLHVGEPNRRVDFDSLGLRLVREREPWPTEAGAVRVAGVSAFGFGGTNAHAVLCAAPPVPDAHEDTVPESGSFVLPLSAHTHAALAVRSRDVAALLAKPAVEGADVARAYCLNRQHFGERLAIVGDTPAQLRGALQRFLAGKRSQGLVTSAGASLRSGRPSVAFVFSGYSASSWDMGREALARHSGFAQAMRRCDRVIRELAGWSILAEMQSEREACRLGVDLAKTQLAFFAIQYSLAALLRSWGVEPAAVVGHSQGEIAAACVCGALSLEDGVRVLLARTAAMADALAALPDPGAMAYVDAGPEEIEPLLERLSGAVTVAAYDSPRSLVLSGAQAALSSLLADLTELKIFWRRLAAPGAGHHPGLAPFAAVLHERLARLESRPPRVPLFSTVTGDWDPRAEYGADYWIENLIRPVRFADAIAAVGRSSEDLVFIELGAHPQLSPAVRRCLALRGRSTPVLTTLSRTKSEHASLLKMAAEFYCLGWSIRWDQLLAPAPRVHVPLPRYPFERVHCWFAQSAGVSADPWGSGAPVQLPLAIDDKECWQVELDLERAPFIADHRVSGRVLVPGTYFFRLVAGVFEQSTGRRDPPLSDVRLERLLALQPGQTVRLQVWLTNTDGTKRAEVYGAALGGSGGQAQPRWIRHLSASLADRSDDGADVSAEHGTVRPADAIAAVLARCQCAMSTAEHYARMSFFGVDYGNAFQLVDELWRRDGEAIGRVRLPSGTLDAAALDACLQVSAAAVPDHMMGRENARTVHLPVGAEAVRVFGTPRAAVWSVATPREGSEAGSEHVADVRVMDDDGAVVAEVRGFRIRRIDISGTDCSAPSSLSYRVQWQLSEESRSTSGTTDAALEGCWHIIPDERRFAESLQAHLRERGRRGTIVRDVRRVASAVADGDRIIDLRQLDLPSNDALVDGREATERIELATRGLLRLASDLRGVSESIDARLWVITQGAQAVPEDAASAGACLQAVAWGVGRSLALELPSRWGGLLDLDSAMSSREAAPAICDAIGAGRDGDQVAVRAGRRWVPRLLRDSVEHQDDRPALLPDATYLITGGTGGIGLVLARWLVDQGARHLVLTTRREPEEAELTSGSELHALRSAGATVRVVRSDVSDFEQTKAVIDSIERAGAHLRGVFHLAGVSRAKLFADVTEEDLSAVLGPKVRGALNLHDASKHLELDHFVVFSSAAGIWGSTGLSVYAGANQFLDRLVQLRRRRGLPALSVAWGLWGKVGMAADAEAQRVGRALGLLAMEPAAALRVLGQLMRSGGAVSVVADVDWRDFKTLFERGSERRLLASIEAAEPSSANAGMGPAAFALRGLSDDEALARVSVDLKSALVRGLGVADEEVSIDEPLDVLGVDSLLALDLKVQFESAYGARVPVVALLGDATIRGVAAEFVRAMRNQEGTADLDLESEARLDPAVVFSSVHRPVDPADATLLTGATGLLGAHVLGQLLARTGGRVYCLVRAKNDAHALQRIETALERFGVPTTDAWRERVVPVPGDLAHEKLGMSDAHYHEVRERARTVVHSGAWLNPVYGYQQLRGTNVGGTLEVLRLASGTASMRVVHVSSLAIFPWDATAGGRRFLEIPAPPPTGLPDGYCQSKWVAERLVEQAAERGLDCAIVRPGLIVGHSRTGVTNDEDLLGRFIKGCAQLRGYPRLPGEVDLTPVDFAAEVVTEIALHPEWSERYYHVTNSRWLPWCQLFEWLRELGTDLEAVEFEAWKARLSAEREGNVLRYLLPLLGVSAADITGVRSFDARNTERLMSARGRACPPPTRDLVARLSAYYLRST